MHEYFNLIDETKLPMLREKVNTLRDKSGRIDISSWFPDDRNSQDLKRFLNSKNFIRLKNKIIQKEFLSEKDLINIEPPYVFVELRLALLAGSSLSNDLLYDIYTHYVVNKIKDAENEIQKLMLTIANLSGKKKKITLDNGAYVYGYICNGLLKASDSLKNISGLHLRTLSHSSSVPALQYDYIIYMDKVHVIKFRTLFKQKFPRKECNKEHFDCSSEEAEKFILDYCNLLGWEYKCVSKKKLAVYNKSL